MAEEKITDIKILRERINEIDQKMAELFEARLYVASDVARYKKAVNMPIFDEAREQVVVENNLKHIANPEYKMLYECYIKNVMELSKALQRKLISHDVVGYQGIPGAFGHIATNDLFPHSEHRAFATFEDVVKSVASEDIEYGVIPFENSFTGEVAEVSELLRYNDVYICRAYDLKIDQNLLGVKGATLADIIEVHSHPQGISQCKEFIKAMKAKTVTATNTAVAARTIGELGDKTKAAIASKATAKIYNLDVLAENINTSAANTTRFIVITRDKQDEGEYFQMQFTVKNEPGTLVRVLEQIGKYNFNMENLKSHAVHNRPFEYYFHVEIHGRLKEAQDMLSEMSKYCDEIRILGSYDKVK